MQSKISGIAKSMLIASAIVAVLAIGTVGAEAAAMTHYAASSPPSGMHGSGYGYGSGSGSTSTSTSNPPSTTTSSSHTWGY